MCLLVSVWTANLWLKLLEDAIFGAQRKHLCCLTHVHSRHSGVCGASGCIMTELKAMVFDLWMCDSSGSCVAGCQVADGVAAVASMLNTKVLPTVQHIHAGLLTQEESL